MSNLRVYNTLTRKKEEFVPLIPGEVKMYVCGVTVYDYCHLGHARCYVAFDAIYRYLRHLGYRVTYVQNLTDIDDKIINRARLEGGTGDMKSRVSAVARKYAAEYFADMERLNVHRADHYPKATESIEGMQKIIAGLMEKGYAYRTPSGVFFSVSAFPGYGQLSKRNLDDLKAGARVQVDEGKRNPLDFALWKAAGPDEPWWPSPWGEGRPGWHIECSAMSMSWLGPTFDIHGGGQDLIFPHHENERAQSEAFTGRPFVRYWLHNGFVTINQEKMSKSLGNVFNLRDIFRSYDPRVVRHFLLGTHYRSPVDFGSETLDQAQNALFRLDNCYGIASGRWNDLEAAPPDPSAQKAFAEAMDDDFNTAAALAVAHRLASEFYHGKDDQEMKRKIKALVEICRILGLELKNPLRKISSAQPRMELSEHPEIILELLRREHLTDDEIAALAMARQALRKKKKWELADQIRQKLLTVGASLRDHSDGSSSLVDYPDGLKSRGDQQ